MNHARRYHAVATQTASRERLLILLLHAALSSMQQARALLSEGATPERATPHLDKALAIVQELQATLDQSQSPAVTGPLADVYAFVIWRVVTAKSNHRAADVEDAVRAFAPIVDAFDVAIGVGHAR
jgi:flagellar biosynthetic protein FliS